MVFHVLKRYPRALRVKLKTAPFPRDYPQNSREARALCRQSTGVTAMFDWRF